MGKNRTVREATHDKDLVGGFLPFLVHGVWSGLGGQTDGCEEGNADAETSCDTPEHSGGGTGGVDCARAMRTEGDPVSY